MKSREQILQRYVGRNCVEKNHVEGKTEKNKIIFKSCGKFISEKRENREEDDLAFD